MTFRLPLWLLLVVAYLVAFAAAMGWGFGSIAVESISIIVNGPRPI